MFTHDLVLVGGGGAGLTEGQGSPDFRIFAIPTGRTVAIDGMTVTNGRTTNFGAGIANWTSFTGTTDIPHEMSLVHWDLYWFDHPGLYWDRSPLAWINQANTPLMVATGMADERAEPGDDAEGRWPSIDEWEASRGQPNPRNLRSGAGVRVAGRRRVDDQQRGAAAELRAARRDGRAPDGL